MTPEQIQRRRDRDKRRRDDPVRGARIKERMSERRKTPEHKAKARAYYLANAERIKEMQRQRGKDPDVRRRQRDSVRRWKKNNRDRWLAGKARDFDASYGKVSGRAAVLLRNAKKRAAKLQIAFDLDRDWILRRLEAGVCEATGVPFQFSSGRRPFAPSIDEVDPNKGYTKDNAKVVVHMYNMAKSNWSAADVSSFVAMSAGCAGQELPGWSAGLV